MAQQAAVLILAELDEGALAEVVAACSDAGFSAAVESSAEGAIGRLAARKFDALVVHMGTPGGALACMKARGKLLRQRVPILAFVDDEDDASFARAYRAGADEVLSITRPRSITPRLRALPKPTANAPGFARGDAVVADPDRTRGEVLERVLRDAGFRVEVAVDSFATRLQAGRPSLKVAVIDASLDDAPALIAQSRAKGSRCAWIVRARPELLDDLRAKVSRMERVSVVSAYGPPDDVLFETNRLLETRAQEGRADARHLHGAVVTLTWAEDGSEDLAYTYNVSSLGLFVRTIAPPVGDALKMRVLPPGGDASVHLEGKVVWRREFGNTRKEAVPPGFGVRVTGGDLEVWAESCPRALSIRPAMPVDPAEALVAVAKATPPVDVAATTSGRQSLSSVEEMLASVLGVENPLPDGAAPLSIDGGTVVELPQNESDAEIDASLAQLDEQPKEQVASPKPPEVKPFRMPPRRGSEPKMAAVRHEASSAVDPGLVDAKDPQRVTPGPRPAVAPPPPRGAGLKGTIIGQPPPKPPDAKPTPSPTPPVAREPAEVASPPASPEQIQGAPATAPEPGAVAASGDDTVGPDGKVPALARTMPAPWSGAQSVSPEIVEAASEKQRQREITASALGLVSSPEAAAPPMSVEVTSQDLMSEMLGDTEPPPAPARPVTPPALPVAPAARATAAEPEPTPATLREASLPPPADEPRAAGGPRKARTSPVVWIAGVLVLAGAGALSARAVLESRRPAATTAPAPSPVPSLAAIPSPSVPTPPPASSMGEVPMGAARAAASAEPSAGAAPSTEAPAPAPSAEAPAPGAAAAAPEMAAAPAAAAAGPEPTAEELAALPKGQGFLYVASSLSTNVYVYGLLAGTTNQKIATKCGPRFVRLGTAPGVWQGEGVVHVVKCGAFTRVEMNP